MCKKQENSGSGVTFMTSAYNVGGAKTGNDIPKTWSARSERRDMVLLTAGSEILFAVLL